jgi:hypothetical protein
MAGTENARGVGVEGDGEGLAAEEAGAGEDFGDDGLMAEVHAVEVADGGDDGGGGRGDGSELEVDVQGSW